MITENSLGKPIADTPEKIANFWRWFGKSKVVDKQGRPLVVYHGTKSNIQTFDLSKAGVSDDGLAGKGFYFTYNPDEASGYAESDIYGKGDSPNVLPVYVSLKNPLLVSGGVLPDGRRVIDVHKQYGYGINSKGGAAIKQLAQSSGQDGVVWLRTDGGVGHAVAFRSEQIKSAVGNTGNFDAHKADITALPIDTPLLPKALTSAIRKHLTDKGFSLIGEGNDKSVYKSPSGKSALIIFLDSQPRHEEKRKVHLAWLHYCSSRSRSEYAMHVWEKDDGFFQDASMIQVQAELLAPLPRSHPVAKALAALQLNLPEVRYGDREWQYATMDALRKVKNAQGIALVMSEATDGDVDADYEIPAQILPFFEEVLKVVKACPHSSVLDLHSLNVMLRGSTPVIVDPWYTAVKHR